MTVVTRKNDCDRETIAEILLDCETCAPASRIPKECYPPLGCETQDSLGVGGKVRSLLAIWAMMLVTSAAGQVVDHYYLDPQNVAEISKFRSCAGHHYGYDEMLVGLDFYEVETDPTETNRSMKHYFAPLQSFRDSRSNDALELHSPFDGTIYRVTAEGHESGNVNKQVWIQSEASPDTFAILFHVNLLDLFPDYWNDYPAEYCTHHGADDTDYERLTVFSREVIGYADLRGTISDIAILKKVSSTEYMTCPISTKLS